MDIQAKEYNLSKKRFVYLDELRTLATVFVIAVHTVQLALTLMPEQSAMKYVYNVFNYVFLSCNLLFIMISGALLLPVKGESWKQFYQKRFLKVVVPLIIYYLLYVVAKEGVIWLYPNYWLSLLSRILSGAPSEAPHFWLIYVIIWLYVFTPFLRIVIQHLSNTMLDGLVILILAFQILVTYLDVLYSNPIVLCIYKSYVGVYILGYYLSIENRSSIKCLIYGTGILSICLAAYKILNGIAIDRYIFNNSPLTVFYVMALFLLFRQIYSKAVGEDSFTKIISKYSFGIMLIHWGVLHFVVKQKLHISPISFGTIGGSLLMIILTLLFSLIGAFILDQTLIHWCLSFFSFINRKITNSSE